MLKKLQKRIMTGQSLDLSSPVFTTPSDSCSSSNISSAHSSPVLSNSRCLSLTEFDERFINTLGSALERIASLGQETNDIFASKDVPKISIVEYVKRLFRYCNVNNGGSRSAKALSCSAQALVCTLVYIDRIVARTQVQVHARNLHRLIAVGMLMAFKMNEDVSVPFTLFSKISGVPTWELKEMEFEFLVKLGFCATVTKQEFDSRVALFVSRMKRPSSSSSAAT